jgi:predicted nuclease of predicted toxin-antitoxin system
MRFLVDECAGPALARWLRERGHDVFSVYDQTRGIDDDAVIRRAHAERRILITNDKGFGEKVFRERVPHRGVVLLRLEDERAAVKIEAVRRLLDRYPDRLAERFVVVTEKRIRPRDGRGEGDRANERGGHEGSCAGGFHRCVLSGVTWFWSLQQLASDFHKAVNLLPGDRGLARPEQQHRLLPLQRPTQPGLDDSRDDFHALHFRRIWSTVNPEFPPAGRARPRARQR